MLDLVGNPEDWFSSVGAQIVGTEIRGFGITCCMFWLPITVCEKNGAK